MNLYYSLFVFLFLCVPFQVSGSSDYVDVKLRNSDNIRTVTTQEPFLVISNSQKGTGFERAYNIRSPRIIELNKLIVPVSLYGRHCSVSYAKTLESFPPEKVYKVLPVGTVLTMINFFATLEDFCWFNRQLFKIVHNTGLRKLVPGRGGPMKYYIARDSKGEELALFYTTFPGVDWQRIKGLGEREAINVLSKFTNSNRKYHRVLLVFETYEEYWSKCNYGGVKEEDSSHDPLIALNEMKKMEGIHDFQDVIWDGQRMEVTVDYLALAYLIYRSHRLRIKDIIFLEGDAI